MQKIYDFYKKYETQIKAVAVAIVALLTVIFGGQQVYETGQRNPDPVALATAIEENPDLLAGVDRVRTPTSAPATKPAASLTPTKTATPKPATSTPPIGIATSTPIPGLPTATMPPMAGMCPIPENVWSLPKNEPCHRYIMGANPFDPEIIKIFDTYGAPGEYVRWLNDYGIMWQDWTSSSNEVSHHHKGFRWYWVENPNCDQFAPPALSYAANPCIPYAMVRVHVDGLIKHAFNSRHSVTIHAVECDKGANGKMILSAATCGVYRGGMSQAFADQLQTPYKNTWCDTPTDNPVWTANHLPNVGNGGLYHSYTTEERPGNFPLEGWWFGHPEAVEAADYADYENSAFEITFINQAWQVFKDTGICNWTANPGLATAAGYTLSANFTVLDAMKAESEKWGPSPTGGGNWAQFIGILIPPIDKVPSSGWANQYGVHYAEGEPDGGCIEASFYCIPWSAEGNLPVDKTGILARRFPGDNPQLCDNAPCLVYPTNGVELVYPPFDVP